MKLYLQKTINWPDLATGCSLPTPALNYHRRGFNFQLHAFILNTVLHLIKWDIKSVNSSASINQHVKLLPTIKGKVSFSYIGEMFD